VSGSSQLRRGPSVAVHLSATDLRPGVLVEVSPKTTWSETTRRSKPAAVVERAAANIDFQLPGRQRRNDARPTDSSGIGAVARRARGTEDRGAHVGNREERCVVDEGAQGVTAVDGQVLSRDPR